MTLKELRKAKGLTQRDGARIVGVPLRTYIRYEQNDDLCNSIKYKYMIEALERYGLIDENNGVLTLDAIKAICAEVLPAYDVEYCFLFGSYAKGTASPSSDVDLLVSTTSTGFKFFELVERLKTELKKKVDVLDQKQLGNNLNLVNEILKDGIKVYG